MDEQCKVLIEKIEIGHLEKNTLTALNRKIEKRINDFYQNNKKALLKDM